MLLNIRNLTVSVRTDPGRILVDGVNLRVTHGEIVALVGGSGSGKTTVGLSILRLLDRNLKIDSGQVLWKGEDVFKLTEKEVRRIRGAEAGMVFQEPLHTFDPVFSIREQIDEVLRAHTSLKSGGRYEKAVQLLHEVGIQDADRVLASYPHQLSGGLRQRAMVAQVLAALPRLIIADEATSSIDVTLQAKVLNLFSRLRHDFHVAILLITHDLEMVRHLADRVYVMHQGRIVESGKVEDVLNGPKEDYTKQLLDAAV